MTTAADRALARVRGFRPGVHAAAWARLLDELASAKSCFSDPERKSAYDNRLRQSGSRSQTVESPSHPQLHVAPGSASPDLYPPGMAPTGVDSIPNGTTRVPRPATGPHPANLSPEDPMAPHVPGAATQPSATAQTPVPSEWIAGRHRLSTSQPLSTWLSPVLEGIPAATHARTRPPAVPPPAGVHAASQVPASEVVTESEQSTVREPVPPGPINAHVAPPREEKTSLLPLTAIVASVVVVLTAIVLVIAMRDDAGGSALVPRDPLSAHRLSRVVRRTKLPQPLVPTGPASTGLPPAVGTSAGRERCRRAGSTSLDPAGTNGTANGAAPDPPTMNVVAAPTTPTSPRLIRQRRNLNPRPRFQIRRHHRHPSTERERAHRVRRLSAISRRTETTRRVTATSQVGHRGAPILRGR